MYLMLARLQLERTRQREYDEMNDDALMGAYLRTGRIEASPAARRARLNYMAWYRTDIRDASHVREAIPA